MARRIMGRSAWRSHALRVQRNAKLSQGGDAMLRAGTETGSLVNHLMSRSVDPVPEVGMGVTMLGWTDRHAGTIISVSTSGKLIRVRRDRATRIDRNGMSEAQEYTFASDPNGAVSEYRLGRRGWRGSAGTVALGYRSEYFDYSF